MSDSDKCSEDGTMREAESSSSSSSDSSSTSWSSCLAEKKGPLTLQDAFDWPRWNTSVLMQDPESKSNFLKLVSTCNVEVHESFAGTCAGSISLKQQLRAMAAACDLPMSDSIVVTKTACECNSVAQSFIQSLHQAGKYGVPE